MAWPGHVFRTSDFHSLPWRGHALCVAREEMTVDDFVQKNGSQVPGVMTICVLYVMGFCTFMTPQKPLQTQTYTQACGGGGGGGGGAVGGEFR